MFDSTPSNLPVEPIATPAPVAPAPEPVPSAPAPAPASVPEAQPAVAASPSIQSMPPRPPAASPKASGVGKEPEDIFSDLDQGKIARPIAERMDMMAQPRRGFPLKLFIIGGVSVLVLIGIGVGVWMWVGSSNAAPEPVAVTSPTMTEKLPEKIEQPPAIEQMPEQPVVIPPSGANIPLPETTQPTSVTPVAEDSSGTNAVMPIGSNGDLPVAAKTLSDGVDTDGDSLTNVEETLYGTDSVKSDTDGDGFSDGSEVTNLFSPMSKGVALVTDDHVRKDSWNNWFFLTPKAWKVSALEDRMTIATLSGTTFQVTVALNPEKLSFSAWIASGLDTAGGKTFKTKNGLDAVQSVDGLKTYISSGDTFLVVTYDVGSDPSYEYRTTYAMLINSLIPPAKK